MQVKQVLRIIPFLFFKLLHSTFKTITKAELCRVASGIVQFHLHAKILPVRMDKPCSRKLGVLFYGEGDPCKWVRSKIILSHSIYFSLGYAYKPGGGYHQ